VGALQSNGSGRESEKQDAGNSSVLGRERTIISTPQPLQSMERQRERVRAKKEILVPTPRFNFQELFFKNKNRIDS
jgi:hypothetical protein